MANFRERAEELARTLILKHSKSSLIDANEELCLIPENDVLTDEAWFALMAEVERLVSVAQVVIIFPEEK